MINAPPPIAIKHGTDPMGRAKGLAERMAKVLTDENVTGVSMAVALLTSGVIHQYADTLAVARDLVASMRRLEDLMIESAFHTKSPVVQ